MEDNIEEQSSTFKEELEAVDKRIEELKEQIEIRQALERLHENEDFKKVILEGYFDKEAKRIFDMLITPTSLKRDQTENLMDMMSSIRYFKGYFKTLLINAAMAPEELESEMLYRQEITARESLDNKSESEG